ncbi:death-inducer obliterator 1 isoform X3 [Girardinichthys multiradiatus]|uniref:death-inducer obliterator 1 isoform X3 n=1 Tax=Girardinichthys multiradiatus TaxID=208333 RepID=UPI001FAB8F7C|nr:death-inducer obliterator 1 isoform X3 [Girardinichthys multiradiatus]
MPVEATTDSPENRCPVRRSGRQPKRTDKLEEFLMTAKRGSRKSAPPSVEGGDPPSQTPTDAETASEASFDGNADSKMVEDKAESPERRTRSTAKKEVQKKTQGGRQTRSAGRATVKEEGSSENDEDNKDDKKGQTQDESPEMKDTKPDLISKDVGSAKAVEDSQEVAPEETNEPGTKGETEKTDEEDADKPVGMSRRPVRTYINKTKMAKRSPTPLKAPTPFSRNTAPVKKETKPKAAGKSRNETTEEEEDDDDESFTSSSSSTSSDESDNGGYDPNALYCICRQKHNKRFMICCDRCEEWFHGDCVGITEARGRLMERNGEDYICPNCTAKKNQVVRPATSILPTSTETAKPRADVASQVMASAAAASSASAERLPASGAGLNPSASQAVGPLPPSTASGLEEKAEDQGIKGRIEKATNPSGKKRIKIFQPQAIDQPVKPEANQKVVSARDPKVLPAAEQKAPPEPEQRVETTVEVNTTPTVEVPEEKGKQKAEDDSSLPKCIGPGCDGIAQPESVYCGNDCILKHAAAAMKSITDVKEPKQKDKTKPQKNKSTAKGGAGGKAQKKTQRVSDSDEDFSDDPDPDGDGDDEDEYAEEHPPPPSTASWSSDHNYIAVTPEKTPPISPTVLNKKSPPKEEKKTGKEQNPSPEKSTKASAALRKGKQKSPSQKSAAVLSKSKKSSPQGGSSKVSKKTAPAPTKTAEKSKKPGQISAPAASPFPAGPIHVTGALRVTKSNFTIPKKQPQQKDSTSQSQPDSSSRVPTSTTSSHSSSRPSHPPVSTSHTSPVRPPANNQMRQNIRRSLTDILFKRVTDSDDLKMTEGDVGRLAYAIEKEMFNLCLSTDSKYKNKYRTLMFNLKDPKNKGLFYRVIGRQVTPFRLVRLSAEELLSKEISEWRKPESSEGHSRAHSGHSRHGSRHESGSHIVDMEDAPPSDADVCISASTSSSRLVSAADHDEAGSTPSASAQPSAEGNSGSNVVDVFSSMLKDTTSEHKTHLFDLNCKICTGQKAEDEPASKKARLSNKPDIKSPRQDSRSSRAGDPPSVNPATYPPLDPLTSHQPVPPSYHSNAGPVVPETPPQLYQEDPNVMAPPTPTPVLISPAVSSVSISRRDPRMARLSSATNVVPPALDKPTSTTADPIPAPVIAPVAAPMDAVVKVPLPMPPAPPSAVAVPKSSKKSSAEPPPEGETAIFLYGQETIWKGFVNMQSVAKFVTKAYLVSGSFEHLKEDLPDTIHIGGRISPSTVWDYVGKLKTSLSKELCLIRFQPATEEEEVAYVSLFSYFSSRKKFGVVANNNRRIKDLYLIPLSSKDPLPSKLLPFDGPGLEPARPNLLLGLLICQKDRKRAGAPLETEEKRSKTQTKDADETGLPKPAPTVKADRIARQSLEIPFSTTPPGSPPSSSSEISSSSSTTTSSAVSVLSLLSAVKTPVTSATPGKDSTSRSSSAAASVAAATPLQTILNTIFRNKKQDSDASNSPSDQTGELPATSTMLDPIVQQFTQNPKEKPVEEDEDDRPYDPEEEYDPSRVFNVTKKPADELIKPEVSKQPEEVAGETDDVEYDPEDDSIFDDVKTLIPAQAKPVAENAPDAKRILENLRRIGDQALQKQAEEQTSSTETATAALMLPNTLANSHLLQLGKKVEELVKSSSVAPLINQRRDPRQSRDPRQAVVEQKVSEPEQKEELSPSTELSPSAPLPQEQLQPVVEDHADTSQGPETSLAQEEVKSETLPFMESENEGVSIPLLGEELEPDMEVSYMNNRKQKSEEADKEKTEGDKYSIWPNAASILKAGEDSEYEENSQDAPSSRYHRESTDGSTVTSTIPVLTQSTVADAHSRHMSHHMLAAGFDNEYRPMADVPPKSSFPPPHSLQGQNLMLRPPPPSMLPPMQGPPLMSGPSSIQGHPPTIQVPPPIHGPPPRQGDGNQQYGPPPPSYPPYQNQNQWPNTQQQPPPGPPLQNVLPPRGPPLSFPPVSQRAPPQIFDPSITPQHIGLQGPPPSIPPPPNFEGQNSLPPPRFTSPPPPFNFPANRGPPPPFTGPPPSAHFDNRLPPPALFPSPRAPPPSQHYSKDTPSNSFNPRMDQNPNPPHYFKESLGPPAPPAYRGPSPDQYEDRRGLPTSGELSGPLFKPHNQYGSSRPPPSLLMERRSFDEPRGPPAQENRPHHSQISERYRFDWHSDEPRPVRHGMPLLSHPADGPHGPPSRHGAQSPDLQREDHWRHLSPEMRRKSSITHEDLEPRSGERLSRFEVPHRELASGSSQSLEERQRELSEDRRREREKESPHGGRPSWDRGMGKRWSRDQDWDRGRERERDLERGREGDRSRGRDSEKNRDTEGERHRDQDSEKRRDKEREKEKEKERDRDKDRDRDRPRESDRRDYDRDRARNRDRDRERERDRRRDRSRSRDRDRDRGKDRGKERERDKERDRERDKDRDKERDRERDRERERDRDRERERDRDRSRDQEKRSKEKKEDKKDSKHDTSKEKTKSADSDKYTS